MNATDLSSLSSLAAAKAEDAAAYTAFLMARERVFDTLRRSGNPPEVMEAVYAMSRAAEAANLTSYKAGIEMGKDIYGKAYC